MTSIFTHFVTAAYYTELRLFNASEHSRGFLIIAPEAQLQSIEIRAAKFTYTTVELCVVNAMTCYFRHLKEIFRKAGIEVTPQNRQQIDKIIHDLVGVKYKNCPATGREVKKHLIEDEPRFVEALRKAWSNQK